MFLRKPFLVFFAFVGVAWFFGGNVSAFMGPYGGGYPHNHGSYGSPQQQMGAQNGYSQYMSQPDPYSQYHSHAHAHAPQAQSYGSYNMQPSYGQQYMQNPQMQQWAQSYGNPYSNLGQYGNQVMPQMQQSGYPFNSYMQGGSGGFMQPGGSFGNIATFLTDYNGKPQNSKSQAKSQ